MALRTNKAAFGLVELLVSLVVASLLVGLTVSIYGLFRSTMSEDQQRAAYAQNARVAMDRLSRELRQAMEVVTELPETADSPDQPHEVEFEDGHENDLTYRRYYLENGILKMQVKEYYLASTPSVRVRPGTVGAGGVLPQSRVISTQDVAEKIKEFSIYGVKPLTLWIVAGDDAQEYALRTKVYERNR